ALTAERHGPGVVAPVLAHAGDLGRQLIEAAAAHQRHADLLQHIDDHRAVAGGGQGRRRVGRVGRGFGSRGGRRGAGRGRRRRRAGGRRRRRGRRGGGRGRGGRRRGRGGRGRARRRRGRRGRGLRPRGGCGGGDAGGEHQTEGGGAHGLQTPDFTPRTKLKAGDNRKASARHHYGKKLQSDFFSAARRPRRRARP